MTVVKEYDFLVIGSGVAGMSYALKVANSGKGRVAIVCKTTLEEANTAKAQGGIASVTNLKVDDFDKHIEDTMIAGDFLIDRKAGTSRVLSFESFINSAEPVADTDVNILGGKGALHGRIDSTLMYDDTNIYLNDLYSPWAKGSRNPDEQITKLTNSPQSTPLVFDGKNYYLQEGTSVYRLDQNGRPVPVCIVERTDGEHPLPAVFPDLRLTEFRTILEDPIVQIELGYFPR